MVVALGPGKFYGSSLPRPRFFTDVKFNKERVDPPVDVLDPLLSWAHGAHWSMGGLSFERLRLQGRIEGSIKKLRAQQLQSRKQKKATPPLAAALKIKSTGVQPPSLEALGSESPASEEDTVSVAPSPPLKKKRARKLADEFEKVASDAKRIRGDLVHSDTGKHALRKEAAVASRTRSRSSPIVQKETIGGAAASVMARRMSPRKFSLRIN
ncbi:hypothetical protein HPP92_008364 [Vanilla planifolia]|uniref:Uncharacterized protein n=1 Tax=Vanilla planifolia TaxID=51239 RepID=A0A835V5B7_VANPL|nr:hypothetical protein HPP92_008364 [Vanilla planifolia]